MEIIWLAIVIYSVGLAIVLYLRPSIMFHENGAWKEFGYKRDSRHTIFPFWLFAIVWAIISYAAAASISWTMLAGGVAASSRRSMFSSDDETEYSDSDLEQIRVSDTPSRNVEPVKAKPKPGYYVLDPRSKKGIRKYVYYGTSPPDA